MPASKNSHSTPTVMEKQKATMARYSGESENLTFSLRFRISSSENPMAAQRKPFIVCSMVSQLGI